MCENRHKKISLQAFIVDRVRRLIVCFRRKEMKQKKNNQIRRQSIKLSDTL